MRYTNVPTWACKKKATWTRLKASSCLTMMRSKKFLHRITSMRLSFMNFKFFGNTINENVTDKKMIFFLLITLYMYSIFKIIITIRLSLMRVHMKVAKWDDQKCYNTLIAYTNYVPYIKIGQISLIIEVKDLISSWKIQIQRWVWFLNELNCAQILITIGYILKNSQQ